MADTPEVEGKIPADATLESLVQMHAANKESVGKLNGEFGSRCQTQQELNPDFSATFRKNFFAFTYKSKTNEIGALDAIRMTRLACDAAERYIKKHGHGADLADMALQAAREKPVSSKPKDAAADQVADNVVKLKGGIKELKEGEAKPGKKKGKGKSETGFVEEQKEANAAGDALIRENATVADAPDKREFGSYKLS